MSNDRGPVSNLIERMPNIRFTDCDKDSKTTTRLQRFQGLQQDFKDFRKIIGITCIDRGLWDCNKDYSEDCTRLQGSVRPLAPRGPGKVSCIERCPL